MKKFFLEFKKFAMKGNVMDMAIGVIIGAAFGKIITSLVNDIIMPPIGVLIGGVRFNELSIVLKAATEGQDAVTLNYGNFIQVCFDFLIIAFCIFLVIKGINKLTLLKKKEDEVAVSAPEPQPSKEELLLTEIRDLLKEKTNR